MSNKTKIFALISLVSVLAVTGCSHKSDESPLATQNPEKVQQLQQKSAQDYAAYRQSHPFPGQGQTQGQAQ